MSLYGLMPSSMKVQTFTSTTDNAGGFVQTFTDLYSGVRCRIEDASASRVEQFARKEMHITHEVFTPQDGIRSGMRIVSGGRVFIVRDATREPATGRIPSYSIVFADEQRGMNA
jgi:head-tail adaptor